MLYLDKNQKYHIITSAIAKNIPLLIECLSILEDAIASDNTINESLLELIAGLANFPKEVLFNELSEAISAIASVNFAKEEENKEESKKKEESNEDLTPLKDYHYELTVQLINSELAQDIGQAIAITEKVPFKDLQRYLHYRVKYLNRDAIAKEKQKEKESEQTLELFENINDGTFYDGIDLSML